MAGTDALLASQINGGGCLPPPTPTERPGEALTQLLKHFGNSSGGSAYERYSAQLPTNLAFRTSSRQAMVAGVGGYIDPENMRMPSDPGKMGVTLRRGQIVRVDRPRREGDPLVWQTSTMASVAYHNQPDILKTEE